MPAEDLKQLKIEKSEKKSITAGRKKKPFIIAALIIAALLLGILYTTGVIAPAVTVDITTVSNVYPSQSLSVLNASGYIVAQRKASVASKITGRLVSLGVEEGSRVRKGQIIARLESEDVTAAKNQAAANLDAIRANLEQARTDRDNLKRDYERYSKLITGGFVSQSEFDAVDTRYKRSLEAVKSAESSVTAATAALAAAEANLNYTLIRAPFDGVVLTKNADIGDIITPLGAASTAKAAVVTLADMGSLEVEADVSETSITQLKVGQPCDIQLDAIADTRFRGAIHAIVPTVDRSKATVLVKVTFIDKDLRMLPDMSAKVSFLSRNIRTDELKSRLAVAATALVSRDGGTIVYRVDGGKVRETSLTLGEKLGDMQEVKSGLKAGDKVVINPPSGLTNGSRIKIAER